MVAADLRVKLIKALEPVYGVQDAPARVDVILPAFLQDFFQMIDAAGEGENVTETYRTEDEKVTLRLEGYRKHGTQGSERVITTVTCNGVPL